MYVEKFSSYKIIKVFKNQFSGHHDILRPVFDGYDFTEVPSREDEIHDERMKYYLKKQQQLSDNLARYLLSTYNSYSFQLQKMNMDHLLNRPYVNEVTLQSKTYIKILLFT